MKVCYVDFWPEQLNIVSFEEINDLKKWENFQMNSHYRLLRNGIGLLHRQTLVNKLPDLSIEIVYEADAADLLICSIFGRVRYQYPKKKKVILVFENVEIDFSLPNTYYISSNTKYADTKFHFFCPLYTYMWGFDLYKLLTRQKEYSNQNLNKKFCLSIISNPACAYRNEFVNLLNEYNHVDSFGRISNNAYDPIINTTKWFDPRLSKIFNQYKFKVAMENTSSEGYHTEKIMAAMKAETIPIYWGDPAIEDLFNSESFINLTGLTFQEGLKKVKAINENPEAYHRMYSAPYIHSKSLLKSTLSCYTSETFFYQWISSILTLP